MLYNVFGQKVILELANLLQTFSVFSKLVTLPSISKASKTCVFGHGGLQKLKLLRTHGSTGLYMLKWKTIGV